MARTAIIPDTTHHTQKHEMGLFGLFGSSPEERRKEEVRKGTVAPDRTERRRCWDARDGFWACLDRHNVIDSLAPEGRRIADRECAAEHAVFERDCASAWVGFLFFFFFLLFTFTLTRTYTFFCNTYRLPTSRNIGSRSIRRSRLSRSSRRRALIRWMPVVCWAPRWEDDDDEDDDDADDGERTGWKAGRPIY